MIVYGRNPVLEATKAGKAKKVYIRKGAALYNTTFSVPVTILDKRDFDARFHQDAQGIAAEADEIEIFDLNSLSEELKSSNGVVILDRIQDPHNYGAIIRSAHCFGINHIIVPKYHQAPLTPTVCKASAGAIFYTKIIEHTNLGQACIFLKRLGYSVVACDADGKTDIKEQKVNGKLALIVGSEGRGIREGILEHADNLVKIPMKGDIDSLNAAQSAAVALYAIFMR